MPQAALAKSHIGLNATPKVGAITKWQSTHSVFATLNMYVCLSYVRHAQNIESANGHRGMAAKKRLIPVMPTMSCVRIRKV
eukprot:scaffold16888_cov16-Prasinocladus_malaysianus.AAC.1